MMEFANPISIEKKEIKLLRKFITTLLIGASLNLTTGCQTSQLNRFNKDKNTDKDNGLILVKTEKVKIKETIQEIDNRINSLATRIEQKILLVENEKLSVNELRYIKKMCNMNRDIIEDLLRMRKEFLMQL